MLQPSSQAGEDHQELIAAGQCEASAGVRGQQATAESHQIVWTAVELG